MIPDVFRFSPRVACVPVLHGSGDFALEVRRVMLNHAFDCLAVPLPASFQADVEQAVDRLPAVSVVFQREGPAFQTSWSPDGEHEHAGDPQASYVPIDPCQPVIAAIRIALQERMPRRFIDLETCRFEPYAADFPDPYALKQVRLDRFAAALLPALPPLPAGQPTDRIRTMAGRLRELEQRYESVLLVCGLLDWPWLRQAYQQRLGTDADDEAVEPVETYAVAPSTLTFVLGELPFITAQYEQARIELEADENLSVDGVKEMLLTARDAFAADRMNRIRPLSPQTLSLYLKYVRNLSLVGRRLTPDLYTLAVAAQQIAGDEFARHLIETARSYPFAPAPELPVAAFGTHAARIPGSGGVGHVTVRPVSRLPGQVITWGQLTLRPRPPKIDQQRWRMRWNPLRSCSWPPEDVKIEQFRTHVVDAAQSLLSAGLARSEKFTTSIMDGLDMRETLRHWHTGDLYVKVLPPDIGTLDAVVMLFDSPAEPRDYPWRLTWQAEHDQESTMAFYATNYLAELVGPGIGRATYGGALFLFPPRPVGEIWDDPRLDFADTLEERLLAGACLHSQSPHIALLAPAPPGAAWRKLAKTFRKRWIHLPLSRFSVSTVQQLREVHVLNGKEVRSFAAHFIRKG